MTNKINWNRAPGSDTQHGWVGGRSLFELKRIKPEPPINREFVLTERINGDLKKFFDDPAEACDSAEESLLKFVTETGFKPTQSQPQDSSRYPAIKWDSQAQSKHRGSAIKVIVGRVNCMALFNVEETKNNLGDPEYILENWFLSPQQITCATFDDVVKVAERRLVNFMTLCGFCHEDDKEAGND